MRMNDGETPLIDSKIIDHFAIQTRMKSLGIDGALAEKIAEQAISPFIPYEWDFGDGDTHKFNILQKAESLDKLFK